MPVTPARSEKLDLRLTPQAKRRLYAAAQLEQRSVSDFVLQSALARADEALADQRVFSLNAEQWVKLQDMLDAPTRELPRLKRLLKEPSLFESSSQS
jgi:uncharacterized protein (DUF1778 family)